MRATIIPAECHIRIDDVPLTVAADLMPAGPNLGHPEQFLAESGRPIEIIHFDGVVGTIERRSRVAGRRDLEHFLGAEPLAAYIEVHAAEKARLAAARAEQHAAEEARIAATQKHYEDEAQKAAEKGE